MKTKRLISAMIISFVMLAMCGNANANEKSILLNSDADDVANYYELLEDIESGKAYWITEKELLQNIDTRAITKVTASDAIKRNGTKYGTAYIDIYCMSPGMVIDYWDNVRVEKASDPNILECTLLQYEVAFYPEQNAIRVVMQIYGRHAQGASGSFTEIDTYDF